MNFQDDVITYREMCDAEGVQTLQRGMNYRLNPKYSVLLMSQRANAPYQDKMHSDGKTLEYEGHDIKRNSYIVDPKSYDQPSKHPSGKLTQNGKFIRAIEKYKMGKSPAETVKIYEKLVPGVWSNKGFFDLLDYRIFQDGTRNVYRFILKLSDNQQVSDKRVSQLVHSRIIPTEVKTEVWKRDKGQCVKCGSKSNLHFDHDLPYSKGGTSLSAMNVQLLCMKHNLKKSNKLQ